MVIRKRTDYKTRDLEGGAGTALQAKVPSEERTEVGRKSQCGSPNSAKGSPCCRTGVTLERGAGARCGVPARHLTGTRVEISDNL